MSEAKKNIQTFGAYETLSIQKFFFLNSIKLYKKNLKCSYMYLEILHKFKTQNYFC